MKFFSEPLTRLEILLVIIAALLFLNAIIQFKPYTIVHTIGVYGYRLNQYTGTVEQLPIPTARQTANVSVPTESNPPPQGAVVDTVPPPPDVR
jgi:hypothetical protein